MHRQSGCCQDTTDNKMGGGCCQDMAYEKEGCGCSTQQGGCGGGDCGCSGGSCNDSIAKVGKTAPNFTAAAVMPDGSTDRSFNLAQYLNGSYGWVFFYPFDFSSLCQSEVEAYNAELGKFTELGAKIVSISADSPYAHAAWKKVDAKNNAQFPMVSDITHKIMRAYGVETQEGFALRGSFLIDKIGTVRHISINDAAVGRSIDEALRAIEAVKYNDENHTTCPVNYHAKK